MNALLKNQGLYQNSDLRNLLQDAWKLVEQLNYSQLCDLISAINNVKTIMEYAVRTGMKDDETGNHLSYNQRGVEPIQFHSNYLYQVESNTMQEEQLVFSGNY